tara:strand:+ start:506 stop:1213 length:708 start_codon:yes stop_codon:yes gene_type:complete
MDDDKWYYVMPPNINIMKCELGDTAVEYLWDCINDARENKINANKNLAGNIEESLYLKDNNNYFWDNHLKNVCHQYLKENLYCTSFRNNFTNTFSEEMIMREFWVNFSKQTEFNPVHNHGGVMSFVIWMQIPTRSKEQHDLPISKNTTNPSSSDFQFLYTDILGAISPMTFEMDPETNGTLVLFPSTLSHQVYPFFNSDDYRVSISGNIYFDPNGSGQVTTDMDTRIDQLQNSML